MAASAPRVVAIVAPTVHSTAPSWIHAVASCWWRRASSLDELGTQRFYAKMECVSRRASKWPGKSAAGARAGRRGAWHRLLVAAWLALRWRPPLRPLSVDCLANRLGCTPPRLPSSRLHKKLDQSLNLGGSVCNASRTPRFARRLLLLVALQSHKCPCDRTAVSGSFSNLATCWGGWRCPRHNGYRSVVQPSH